MTSSSSSFPHRPPGADEVGPGRSVDDAALNPAVPTTTTDYQTITNKPPPTANPNPDSTKLKMPETAATRKAQVVPLLGGHDEPEPEASSSSSRPSDDENQQHTTSIDSLTPLTPSSLTPANQHHNSSFVEEDDLTTGKYALRSWLTVLGAWLAIFSSFGLLTVLSICQNYVSGEGNEQQVAASISEGTFAWVFSLYFVVSLGLGMYVGPLSDRFGARWMVLSGTVFFGVGMVVLACRSETWAILLAFGILSGLTSTFLFIPSLVTIHQFFSRSPRYYTFATSLATTAGPTAGIVFPYATRNLFHEVNWPWTIRTLGLICFFLAAIANFLIRSPPPSVRAPAPLVPTSPTFPKKKKSRTPSPPPSSSASSASSSASANSTTPMVVGGPSSAITPSASARPALVGKLASAHPSLTNPFFSSSPSYTLLFLSLLLIHLSIYTTTTYLSASSLFSQGYSHSFTFRTTTLVVNISSIGGRLLAGLLASGSPLFWSSSSASTKPPGSKAAGGMLLKGLGAFNTTISFSLLATLSLLAVLLPPILHPGRTGMSPSRFTAFAVLFGLSSGAVLGLEPVLVSLVCGGTNNNHFGQFGQYFGTLYTLISLASMSGIPIGSHLINTCGGMYWGLVVFVGVSFGVGMLGLLLVRHRSVVNQTGGDKKKGKKGKKNTAAAAAAAAAAVAGGDCERIDDGLKGFEWKKMLSLWKERKTWSELTERVGRSFWEVWGLERV